MKGMKLRYLLEHDIQYFIWELVGIDPDRGTSLLDTHFA